MNVSKEVYEWGQSNGMYRKFKISTIKFIAAFSFGILLLICCAVLSTRDLLEIIHLGAFSSKFVASLPPYLQYNVNEKIGLWIFNYLLLLVAMIIITFVIIREIKKLSDPVEFLKHAAYNGYANEFPIDQPLLDAIFSDSLTMSLDTRLKMKIITNANGDAPITFNELLMLEYMQETTKLDKLGT